MICNVFKIGLLICVDKNSSRITMIMKA